MEIIKWLEGWYSSHCDGDWEHEYGLTIGTLDNPGWTIKIDLTGTGLPMADLPYQRYEKEEGDWYDLSIRNGVFSAAGDPSKLAFLLEKFREFVISNCP